MDAWVLYIGLPIPHPPVAVVFLEESEEDQGRAKNNRTMRSPTTEAVLSSLIPTVESTHIFPCGPFNTQKEGHDPQYIVFRPGTSQKVCVQIAPSFHAAVQGAMKKLQA